MAEKKPVVMTISDVIRHNVRRYRGERNLSQRELAELLHALAGDAKPWTQFRVSDIEGGRKGRDRTVSPEELLALARGLDISLIELMTPPDVLESGEDGEGNPLLVPVRIRVGRDEVPPDLFFRLAFLLPANLREQWGKIYGTADQAGKNSELVWRNSIISEAIKELFTADDLRKRYPGFEQLTPAELLQLSEGDFLVEIGEWILNEYGGEVLRSVFFSDRTRELFMKDDGEKGDDDE